MSSLLRLALLVILWLTGKFSWGMFRQLPQAFSKGVEKEGNG